MTFAEEIKRLLEKEKKSGVKEPELTWEEIADMKGGYIPSEEEKEYEEMRNPRLRDDERI